MASLLAVISCYLLVTFGVAWLVAEKRDQRFIYGAVTVAWLVGIVIIPLMNGWMPFAEGHDDKAYFHFASIPAMSFSGALNLNRYVGLLEQPGYPAFLSVIAYWAGADLLVLKFSNFVIYLLTCLTWYRIVVEFNSRFFARYMLSAMMFLTPLWYYIFFLLKDMSIVFLQSVFLLGLVQMWIKPNFRSLAIVMSSTIVLILLRTPLIIQHVALVLVLAMSKLLFSGSLRNKILIIVFSIFTVLIVLHIATSPEILVNFGIVADGRVLDAEAALEMAEYHQERSKIQWKLFPILYVLAETSGLSPASWERMDHQWVRGVLTLTWIFIIVPFVALGVRWLMVNSVRVGNALVDGRVREKSIFKTPWTLLLSYIASYVAISYSVGDTTRWRIPDMPAYLMIGVVGWLYAARSERWWVLFLWMTGIGALLGIFYFNAEVL